MNNLTFLGVYLLTKGLLMGYGPIVVSSVFIASNLPKSQKFANEKKTDVVPSEVNSSSLLKEFILANELMPLRRDYLKFSQQTLRVG
jgi:hypothetical protein